VAFAVRVVKQHSSNMNTFFTTTEKTRWMIVDDNEPMLLMLANAVKGMTSAEVECYSSPTAALAAFAAAPGKYALVITDYEMPEMDGAELCRQMRAISLAPQIFLATGSGLFTEDTAYEARFNAVLTKPFPLSQLHKTLAQVLGTETICAG
jgi:CheY-like chemotaxis protein